MSKISELSDGGSLVSSDYLIAVRSGGNVKVRMDQINVDQVDLGDNEFIRLGNSQDLTMVHTSTQSIINQAGIGDLLIQKAGATKLTINASGIDVTGSVTTTGSVGIGTSPSTKLHLGGAAPLDSIIRQDSTVSGTNWEIGERSAGKWQIWEDDTDSVVATFTSSGSVGIGTSSPEVTAHVSNAVAAGSDNLALRIQNPTNAADARVGIGFHVNAVTGSGWDGAYIQSANSGSDNGDLRFGSVTNNTLTERMRIDSSGTTTFTKSGGGNIRIAETASRYAEIFGYAEGTANGSTMAFHTIQSGTSTSTERMRIDSSGNLLVGQSITTIPGVGNTTAGVSIRGQDGSFFSRILGSGDTNNVVSVNRSTADGNILGFQKDGTTVGSIGSYLGSGTSQFFIAGADTGFKFNSTVDVIAPSDGSGGTRDAAIDLGDAGSRFKNLYLSGGVYANNPSGAFLWNAENAAIAFGTNNLERMRIDSLGDVSIGTTGGGARLRVSGAANTSASIVQVGTVGYPAIDFRNPSFLQVGYILVTSNAVSLVSVSDQRLKENIADADDAGSKIDSIQVRKFDWKSDGSHQDYGMVAQELLEVAPEAVSAQEDPEKMMGVDYSKLVPMMLKEIQSLRARVAQLES